MQSSDKIKVTVVKGKKEVYVVGYGSEPLHIEGGIIIPNGFQVETFVSGYWLVGSTKVDSVENKVTYCFSLRDDERITSGWKKSPTGALDEINKRLKNARHKLGTNGQIMIGVKYESIQELIRERFPQGESSSQSVRPSRKRSFAAASTSAAGTDDDESGEDFAPPVRLNRQRKVKVANTALITPNKRTKTINSRPAAAAKAEQEVVVDERSMQPTVFVPEPNVTPSKHQRSDSLNESDDFAMSSQPSLDLAALDVRSQEGREKFLDKMNFSQMSQDDGTNIKAREDTLQYADAALVASHTILSFKIQRTDTQTSDVLVEENSIQWSGISVSSQ